MSLINQMLKDLDARHESDARGRLHREIRPLPAASPAGAATRVLVLASVVLLLGVLAWFGYRHWGPEVLSVPEVPAAAMATNTVPAIEVKPAAVSPAATVIASSPVVPGSETASAMPVPPSDAVDDVSGLKFSSALDRVPPEPAPRREKPRVSPAATAAVAPSPAMPKTPSASDTVRERPATAPMIEKSPPAKSLRDRADADYRRAIGLVNGARTTEAVDALIDALRHDGGHVASRQLLARLLVEQRRHDEAMATLLEGLAGQPGQVQWAMMLARLQVDRGDLSGASRTLQGSLPFAKGNADYLGFFGLVTHRLGQQKDSVQHYQSAALAAPGDGRWWLGLGLALEADRRPEEARDAFLRARATGTLNPDLAAVVDQKLR